MSLSILIKMFLDIQSVNEIHQILLYIQKSILWHFIKNFCFIKDQDYITDTLPCPILSILIAYFLCLWLFMVSNVWWSTHVSVTDAISSDAISFSPRCNYLIVDRYVSHFIIASCLIQIIRLLQVIWCIRTVKPHAYYK